LNTEEIATTPHYDTVPTLMSLAKRSIETLFKVHLSMIAVGQIEDTITQEQNEADAVQHLDYRNDLVRAPHTATRT
jgi:hypothetical protein